MSSCYKENGRPSIQMSHLIEYLQDELNIRIKTNRLANDFTELLMHYGETKEIRNEMFNLDTDSDWSRIYTEVLSNKMENEIIWNLLNKMVKIDEFSEEKGGKEI